MSGDRYIITDQQQVYFLTLTVVDWVDVFTRKDYKLILVDSLNFCIANKGMEVFAYVIMPNHIHLMWNFLKLNGKESPAGSFAKFTAHQFKKYLFEQDTARLQKFVVSKTDRKMQFWKRDPLAIPLTCEENLIQKLEYIHNNPIKEKWKLALLPEEYRWSSASFYKNGSDEFGFLTHFRD